MEFLVKTIIKELPKKIKEARNDAESNNKKNSSCQAKAYC